MNDQIIYCCTDLKCNHESLTSGDNGLSCPNGHFYPFAPGTDVPIFAREAKSVNEYTVEEAASRHDNSLKWVFSTFEADELDFRKRLIARLNLSQGNRILITGAGAGNDLPHLASELGGDGQIFSQDIAQEMMLAGADRYRDEIEQLGVGVFFSISDATNLPFKDNYFDAAFHFGGINLYSDIKKGISEMGRVVKSGGKVVIGDEGVAPWLKDTEYGQMLINNNQLYACEIPLSLLPTSAQSVNLSWELSNCFYIIEFIVSNQSPKIDIDVPHIGTRGGSIRTRYFGDLEGVDPDLRDKIYNKAEKLGLSRVEFMETLLRDGLSDDGEKQ